jgi:hypothetical protein
MVVLFLIFLEISVLFSKMAVPIFYIPIKSATYIFVNICYLLPFIKKILNSHPTRNEVIPHCGFDFHFPDV